MLPASSRRPVVPEAAGVFDPERVIRALDEHGVRYVLVGGVAARLHGSPTLTEDIDITPEPSVENLRCLARALEALDARLAAPDRDDGLAVALDEGTFTSPVMSFATNAGVVDVIREPLGTGLHDRLLDGAVAFEVFGIRVTVASLDQVIASKEAASRAKDRAHLDVLQELRSELRGRRT